MASPAGKEVETGNRVGRWMETDRGKVRPLVLHFLDVFTELPASKSESHDAV